MLLMRRFDARQCFSSDFSTRMHIFWRQNNCTCVSTLPNVNIQLRHFHFWSGTKISCLVPFVKSLKLPCPYVVPIQALDLKITTLFLDSLICFYTPVHLAELVETVDYIWDDALHAAVTHMFCITHLLLCACFVMMPAPSTKLCAIASYSLFHSHTQVKYFTNSTRWTGVYRVYRVYTAKLHSVY